MCGTDDGTLQYTADQSPGFSSVAVFPNLADVCQWDRVPGVLLIPSSGLTRVDQCSQYESQRLHVHAEAVQLAAAGPLYMEVSPGLLLRLRSARLAEEYRTALVNNWLDKDNK